MKIVVQLEPDDVELLLNEVDSNDFIVDQEAFCYFRDEVFIKEMEVLIKKITKNKWKETEGVSDYEAVKNQYNNQRLINKYYPKYNRRRKKYHLYKGNIYFFEFVGFMNVTNEIQLILLEPEDIEYLLNEYSDTFLNRVFKRL